MLLYFDHNLETPDKLPQGREHLGFVKRAFDKQK
jgi:hypothetical protein